MTSSISGDQKPGVFCLLIFVFPKYSDKCLSSAQKVTNCFSASRPLGGSGALAVFHFPEIIKRLPGAR